MSVPAVSPLTPPTFARLAPLTRAACRTAVRAAMPTVYRSPLRVRLLQLVAEYGALTGDQLHRLCQRAMPVTANFAHFEHHLETLCTQRWLQAAPNFLHFKLRAEGLRPHATPTEKVQPLRVYLLGQVGTALVPPLWPLLGRDPRGVWPSHSPVHDVLCAEAVLRLAEGDPALEPWPPAQAALWEADTQKFFCRPDGLLRHATGPGWVVEFCNEAWMTAKRLKHKLGWYEDLVRTGRWAAWDVPVRPRFLVVYRAQSTAKAFAQEARRRGCFQDAPVWGLALRDVLQPEPLTPQPLIADQTALG